ncbi:MAG: hypothetical protein ACXQTS_02450, partial [Candidatus Methanospirareceae archaeon]
MKREDRWRRISISSELVEEIKKFMDKRGEKKSIAGFLTEAARFYMDSKRMRDIKEIKEVVDNYTKELTEKLHRLLIAAYGGYYPSGFAETHENEVVDEDLEDLRSFRDFGDVMNFYGEV